MITDKGERRLLRAHPQFDRFGPFFDWAMIDFEVEDSVHPISSPAKVLLFYKDGLGVDSAIVNSAEYSTDKETELGNTRLTTNHRIEFKATGWPALRKIPLCDIRRGIFVQEHRKDWEGPIPGRVLTTRNRKTYIVTVVEDVDLWPQIFYQRAKGLPKDN